MVLPAARCQGPSSWRLMLAREGAPPGAPASPSCGLGYGRAWRPCAGDPSDQTCEGARAAGVKTVTGTAAASPPHCFQTFSKPKTQHIFPRPHCHALMMADAPAGSAHGGTSPPPIPGEPKGLKSTLLDAGAPPVLPAPPSPHVLLAPLAWPQAAPGPYFSVDALRAMHAAQRRLTPPPPSPALPCPPPPPPPPQAPPCCSPTTPSRRSATTCAPSTPMLATPPAM